ncbi:hypothetical protein [uncultured Erythrobacter sp.]|uniref:hypothetical protein n=1 Tax=uncultured Erythrobacter sp. TaxID=263913 RepID=UPI00262DCDE9|nr:hypothetical protein [uncultured Erythrobacter sp.]
MLLAAVLLAAVLLHAKVAAVLLVAVLLAAVLLHAKAAAVQLAAVALLAAPLRKLKQREPRVTIRPVATKVAAGRFASGFDAAQIHECRDIVAVTFQSDR